MSTAQTMPRISPQMYLESERRAAFKSEYYDGHIYAMAGASEAHQSISANVIMEIGPALKKKGCKIYPSDMKVWIPLKRSFVYPDLSIACGTPKMHDEHRDVLENPIVVFEILSPSTELHERTLKFDGYCSIPELQHYLLISQETARVEVYTKNADELWVLARYTGLDQTLQLPAGDVAIPMASLYDKIEFPAA